MDGYKLTIIGSLAASVVLLFTAANSTAPKPSALRGIPPNPVPTRRVPPGELPTKSISPGELSMGSILPYELSIGNMSLDELFIVPYDGLPIGSIPLDELPIIMPVEKYIIDTAILVSNTNNLYRYIANKSEKDGIEDLEHLVRTARFDEQWAFLPDKKQWVEFGNNERFEPSILGINESSVGIDVTCLDKLIKENDNLILYHYRPLSIYNFGLIYGRILSVLTKNKKISPEMLDVLEEVKKNLLAYSALPLCGELSFMISVPTWIQDSNPNANIRFKICSAYGVTEYALTEKGRKHFKGKKFLYIRDWVFKHSTSDNELRIDPSQSGVELVKELIRGLSNEYFTVTFIPYSTKGEEKKLLPIERSFVGLPDDIILPPLMPSH